VPVDLVHDLSRQTSSKKGYGHGDVCGFSHSGSRHAVFRRFEFAAGGAGYASTQGFHRVQLFARRKRPAILNPASGGPYFGLVDGEIGIDRRSQRSGYTGFCSPDNKIADNLLCFDRRTLL
jgi:hypothetical protein